MIKVDWDVEELVALIDIYLREQRGEISNLSVELEGLSATLNRRADRLGILRDAKYRNTNGMKMQYQNVDCIATNGARGLSSYSEAMKIVFQMSQLCPKAFQLILQEFNLRYR